MLRLLFQTGAFWFAWTGACRGPVGRRDTRNAVRSGAGTQGYLYIAMYGPWASISSSHIFTMSSIESSAAVCGSSIAAR